MCINKIRIFLVVCSLLFCHLSFGQAEKLVRSGSTIKPVIDFNTTKEWQSVNEASISNTGMYVFYKLYSGRVEKRCVLQSIVKDWKRNFNKVYLPTFTKDDQFLIYMAGGDTLRFYNIEQDTLFNMNDILSFSVNIIGGEEWLCCFLKNTPGEMILRNLSNGKELRFHSISNCQVIDNNNGFILQSVEQKNDKKVVALKILNIINGTEEIIWTSFNEYQKIINFSFDRSFKRVGFVIHDNLKHQNEVWGYNISEDSAFLIANDSQLPESNRYKISGGKPEFSDNGKYIFFTVEPFKKATPVAQGLGVDIWRYTDKVLPPVMKAEDNNDNFYKVEFNIETRKVTLLENEREKIAGILDDYVLLRRELGYFGLFETDWNKEARFAFTLLSLKDGSRTLVKDNIINPNGCLALSPKGRWILFYDFESKNYFSYEVKTGTTRNITEKCGVNWLKDENQYPEPKLTWVPWRNTWLKNDSAVMIYDNYDIWLIDPGCHKAPINITNSYGKKSKIKFELLFERNEAEYEMGGIAYLKAVDKESKDRGFFSIKIAAAANPIPRCMGPYVFGAWEGYDGYNAPPIKSIKNGKYLVMRMSATEARNYFVTSDFVNFKQVTDVKPQKQVNWLTTELVKWKTKDGILCSGVLYKPENFNPKNKYPIIFDYYEKRSDELNLFIDPKPSENRINIPWFVSNGYLVFAPDIHYKFGEPGRSALESVVSAAENLSKYSWIDRRKMGLQGHSFGGYETNYIISHTKIFAAATSASGFCNLVSFYGSGARGSYPIYWAERNQGRLEKKLWEAPERYISNSPIFNADKISTPLLMMNNKGDRTVPFAQGVEFFSALRRLGKKVWMLQYDGQGHSLNPGGPEARDFHFRMLQFYNHFLMGMSVPEWMTQLDDN